MSKKKFKFVKMPFCIKCSSFRIKEGSVVCPKCGEKNPKLLYKHEVIYENEKLGIEGV